MGVRLEFVRLEFVFLLVLGVICATLGARSNFSMSDPSSLQINDEEVDNASELKSVCSLCEQFTTQAITYMNVNRTKSEIIDTLHNTCSVIVSSFQEQECSKMVDHYSQIFFEEMNTMQPSEFCKKVKLCGGQANILVSNEDICSLCDHAVKVILATLKDRDVELEIIEVLLNICDILETIVNECMELTIKYVPMILSDLTKLLETIDICSTLHVCVAMDHEKGLPLKMSH